MYRFDHDYGVISKRFNLHTVKSIHDLNDLCFLYKTLASDCNNNVLANLFKFKDNSRTRRHTALVEMNRHYDSEFFNSAFRLGRNWNHENIRIRDFESYYCFKNDLKNDCQNTINLCHSTHYFVY